MYKFCSNNALYSASFSFIVFISLLIFLTNQNLSLVSSAKDLLIRKACNIFFSLQKNEKNNFPHYFIFYSSCISLERYFQQMFSKVGVWENDIKIWSAIQGAVYRRGIETLRSFFFARYH